MNTTGERRNGYEHNRREREHRYHEHKGGSECTDTMNTREKREHRYHEHHGGGGERAHRCFSDAGVNSVARVHSVMPE